MRGKCNVAKMIVLPFNARNTKATFQDFPPPRRFYSFLRRGIFIPMGAVKPTKPHA